MSFHEFNPFTGRLKQSSQFQALSPVSPAPLSKKSPTIIYDTVMTKPVETGSGAAQAPAKALKPKLQRLMEHYQKDMHKPVYLLGGRKDVILFGITCGLVGLTTLASFKFAAEQAMK